jgi:signal transduction histidine kinase/purine-cytosine permease-like protein/DNA-binding NarL/FixJ family response regulator
MNDQSPSRQTNNAKQQIFRTRRSYNQWVNNQTLEDYALRFTAKSARKWSLGRVANTALGAISFLALEAIGAAITISYGFPVAITSILVVGALIFIAGLPICYYAAKYGVDIDLLTRGAGFGYIGSSVTSLIYASFTFIFFALEAAIMAALIKLVFGLPLEWGYLVCAVVVIPLVTHGITFISKFQAWTQPVWIILQLLPLAFIIAYDMPSIEKWLSFTGMENQHNGAVSIMYFGSACAVLFALIAQIGEQVDYLRFLPEKTKENRFRWWFALLSAGPGWIIIGILKMLIGSLLAYLLWQDGFSAREATDPANMYLLAFEQVVSSPEGALILTAIFVVVCQLKINVTNAYAGSIAWSNFFSRLTHNHPGRVVWLVFNVTIALMLMELGIYQAFEDALGVYAILAVCWVAALFSDLTICKPFGLSPKRIEFKRAYLYDINPVGVGSMIVGSFIGALCYLGVFGQVALALAHFIAIAVTVVLAPIIAIATKGNYYIARSPDLDTNDHELECVVCQNKYETEDIASCPAYGGGICSLCCSLDARCNDLCKPHSSFTAQSKRFLSKFLPKALIDSIHGNFSQFIIIFIMASAVTGVLLFMVYVHGTTESVTTNEFMASTLWKVFMTLNIVIGVVCWLFVLAHDSRLVAQEESNTQNRLLLDEIEAHKITDAKLQAAKEVAESANNAKSRYLTGLSHELRTPLNSIMGYAQLLERKAELDNDVKSKVSVIKKSGEHLTDLIEGLLDISKIEAGRLDVNRDIIHLHDLIEQLNFMFRQQAQDKGLEFQYQEIGMVPDLVVCDEKHLRQILINLLSNAVKFTDKGKVLFSVSYRNQVARFTITDTGPGIATHEIERAFKPFERIRTNRQTESQPGTGLGLTITQLLTEILGGNIELENTVGGGLTAKISIMLPTPFSNPELNQDEDNARIKQNNITGYKGARKTITVVDDDPMHRGLMGDILGGLGFITLEAHDAFACLELHHSQPPDLYLLDISMPEMTGWQLVDKLRGEGYRGGIIMLSANAKEYEETDQYDKVIDDYITKPVKLRTLINKLSKTLEIDWEFDHEAQPKPELNAIVLPNSGELNFPETSELQEILDLVSTGHLAGLKIKLNKLKRSGDYSDSFFSQLEPLINNLRFEDIEAYITRILNTGSEALSNDS